MKQPVETGELRNPSSLTGLDAVRVQVDVVIRNVLPDKTSSIARGLRQIVEQTITSKDIRIVTETNFPILLVTLTAKVFDVPPYQPRTHITGVRASIRLDDTVALERSGESHVKVPATLWNSGATTALFLGIMPTDEIESKGAELIKQQAKLLISDHRFMLDNRDLGSLLNSDPQAENIRDLATVIMSEASIGNFSERQAVGSTVLNRMARNQTDKVKDVWGGFAHNQSPTQEILTMATHLIKGPLADNSNGSTHFYSPNAMPKEGDNTTGFDVGGGLEQTPGLSKKNYRPKWSLDFEAKNVTNVRPVLFKFYRQPGNGPVT
jgi:hypothetical protein